MVANRRLAGFALAAVAVAMMVAEVPAYAQDAAPSSHMVYNDSFNADIMINEVRVPADGEATYTYYETLGWSGVLGGYAGIQAHPDGHPFIFSIWDNVAHTNFLESAYALPGTQVEGFGGEGTGMKNMNFKIGWDVDTWYVFVVRSWAVGDRTHIGCWVRKGDNDLWYHLATVDVAVNNAYIGGATDAFLEDWIGTGEYKRTTNLRRGWKRKPDKSWYASTMSYYSVNQVDLDPGGRSYNYRTNWDGGTNSDETGPFYYMTAGGSTTVPTTTNGSWHSIPRNETSHGFAPAVINQLTGDLLTASNLRLRWNNDGTTSPQFSYQVEVYGNAGGAGSALLAVTNMVPQTREYVMDVSALNTAGTTYYAFLSVVDIFGQTSTPVSLEFGMGATPDYITVTAPDGGESFTAGGAADITWSSSLGGTFDIYLTKGGVRMLQIAAGVGGSSNRWDIPVGMPGGDDYRIEVESGAVTNDSNNDFSIAAYDYAHVSLSTTNLSVYSCDSQQAGSEATYVLDNNPTSIWHTQWSPTVDPYPHYIVLKTDKPCPITGLTYLPRIGAGNGTIKDYEIYVSMDAVIWGTAVATGAFESVASTQAVYFNAKEGQYVKLVALSEKSGGAWASAAEIRALYQMTSHTITASAGTGGSITPSGEIRVVDGGSSAFVITADENYSISNVVVDGIPVGATNMYQFSGVVTGHTIAASFAIDRHTVIFDIGTNGVHAGGGALTQLVAHGSAAVEPTVTPDSGYLFLGWDGPYSNVTFDVILHAQYALDIRYTLEYFAGTNGHISGVSSQLVSEGSSGTAVTAVPDSGYRFDQWSDGSTQNPRTDTGVTSNISVTAGFVVDVLGVANSGGSPSNTTSAVLSGQLTGGSSAAAWICWGDQDVGITSTGNWGNVISVGAVTEGSEFSAVAAPLVTNKTYWYRCFVSNGSGAAWSDSAEAFSGELVSSGGEWTPADFSGVVAWYDAMDVSSIYTNVTGTVTRWDDKSSNGYDAVQTNSSYQPMYNVADLVANGMPSVKPANPADKSGVETPSFTFSNLYVVTYWKDGTVATFDNYDTLLHNSVVPANRNYRIMGSSGTSTWWTANQLDQNPYRNGSSVGTNKAVALPLSILRFESEVGLVTQGNALGFNQENSGRTWDGGYCEWIFTDGSEDLATKQKIEGYLAHKWGIEGSLATGHPYTNTPPGGGAEVIANLAPTNVTGTQATMNASLSALGTNYEVYVYWGTSDGGSNALSWDLSASLGEWNDVSTNISYGLSGLIRGQIYFYTFRAGSVWASPSWQFVPPAGDVLTTNHLIPYTWIASTATNAVANYENAALDDPDHDGFSTWEEYWSGTNPNDSNSYLKIDAIVFDGANIQLQWSNSVVGAGVPALSIEATTDLMTGSWQKVAEKDVVNGPNSWSNAASQRLYYRLAVTNAP